MIIIREAVDVNSWAKGTSGGWAYKRHKPNIQTAVDALIKAAAKQEVQVEAIAEAIHLISSHSESAIATCDDLKDLIRLSKK